MARPTKARGMDVTPFSGVKIQKVGAIYTRTLEEGGAIYVENGVSRNVSLQPRYGFARTQEHLGQAPGNFNWRPDTAGTGSYLSDFEWGLWDFIAMTLTY